MKPTGESSAGQPTPTSSYSPPSPSGYKGVRKRKWGKWVSEIRLPNSRERIWLGSYESAEKAARAFDAALFCLRGRNAKFNFPDSPPRITGAQGLSHQEIQAMAAQYASQHHPGSEAGGADTSGGQDATSAEAVALHGDGEQSMDWSFLGALDESERMVSDLGFLYTDMEGYMTSGDSELQPPPAMNCTDTRDRDAEDDGDHASGNYGGDDYIHHGPSFLWNF